MKIKIMSRSIAVMPVRPTGSQVLEHDKNSVPFRNIWVCQVLVGDES